jgi:hypothetical protein
MNMTPDKKDKLEMAKMISKAASALGRLARGVPKTYTDEERERRRKRLAELRKKRWVPKKK